MAKKKPTKKKAKRKPRKKPNPLDGRKKLTMTDVSRMIYQGIWEG
jgi:hypothetical protein